MKEARSTRRLAQRDLAKQIGMNRSGLQMAEAGQAVMSKRNRERLEAVLRKMPEDVRRWLATQDAERSKAHSKLAEEDLSPLGRLLRARRLSLGLSQEEVAERLGRTSENFMQTVEAGSLRLKDKVLEDLAEALELPEVPAEWLEAREEAGQTGIQRNERKAEEVPQLGAEIRRLRKAKGFSRARLASLCGLSVTYLGKLELGGCAASDETLLKIACGIGFEKVPGQWFTLREASGQNLQHTHGGMNDALSPFGAKLRHLRMSCKVIQSELDRRCGMSKGYICRLEYGRER